jgi:nitrogen regulatory protein PII
LSWLTQTAIYFVFSNHWGSVKPTSQTAQKYSTPPHNQAALTHFGVILGTLTTESLVRPPARAVPTLKVHGTRESVMKLIIAVIKPFKLDEVRVALTAIGVRGMMVSEVKGFGTQSGHTEVYRGAEYVVQFVPKLRLEIVVPDDLADQVVATIAATAKTDKIGDGKIFTLDVEGAMRVRTGETNDDAL